MDGDDAAAERAVSLDGEAVGGAVGMVVDSEGWRLRVWVEERSRV